MADWLSLLLMSSVLLSPADYVLFQWQPVPGSPSTFPLGNYELQTGSLSFNCAGNVDANFYVESSNKNCWSAKLNGIEFFAGDTKQIVSGVKAQFNPRGFVQVNNGKVDLKNAWIDWFIIPDKALVRIVGASTPPLQIIDTMGSLRVDYQNDFAYRLNGGLEVNRFSSMVAAVNSQTVEKSFNAGKSGAVFDLENDALGSSEIQFRPYISFPDMRLPVSGNTAFCSTFDGVRQCYAFRKIPMGEFATIIYKVVPVGTDLSKDVSVACNMDSDCPKSFVCQQSICMKGVRSQPEPFVEAFGSSSISTGAIAIVIVLVFLIVLAAVKRR